MVVVQKLAFNRSDYAPLTLDAINVLYETIEDMQRATRRMLAPIGIEYYLHQSTITFVVGGQGSSKKHVKRTREILDERVRNLGYIGSAMTP
jgi:hypothetical protein